MAATLSEIRSALAQTIADNATATVYTYFQLDGIGELPAVIVYPDKANYNGAFHKGLDEWYFKLFVIVSAQDLASAQSQLDSFITGTGENSIRQILHENADLGLPDPVDAHLMGMHGYGGSFAWYGADHLGAILNVLVRVNSAH